MADEVWEEINPDEPIYLDGYNKLYAVQGFRTKNGIESYGLIEVGNKES